MIRYKKNAQESYFEQPKKGDQFVDLGKRGRQHSSWFYTSRLWVCELDTRGSEYGLPQTE